MGTKKEAASSMNWSISIDVLQVRVTSRRITIVSRTSMWRKSSMHSQFMSQKRRCKKSLSVAQRTGRRRSRQPLVKVQANMAIIGCKSRSSASSLKWQASLIRNTRVRRSLPLHSTLAPRARLQKVKDTRIQRCCRSSVPRRTVNLLW